VARITVDQAEIHTASVEVKTLTLKGKQVTLAVFRQLQQETLLDADGSFIGLPWGTVNYHPEKGCPSTEAEMAEVAASKETHLHVVWQKENELRRATVYEPEPYPNPNLYRSEHGDRWLKVALLAGWRPDERPSSLELDRVFQIRRGEGKPGLIPVQLSRAGEALLSSDQALMQWGDQLAPDRATQYNRQRRTALEALARDGYDYCSNNDSWSTCADTLWAAASRFADDVDLWQRRFCERWAELEAVPQLFRLFVMKRGAVLCWR
jgi:hypothetical protein